VATRAVLRLPTAELGRRARALEWLVLDVDGVLTTGAIAYHAGNGSQVGEETIALDIHDTHAIELARHAGLKVAVLTGRDNPALAAATRGELHLDLCMRGRADKGPAFAELCAQQGIDAQRVAAIGDDLQDLPVLLACGLSFAPADAATEVREVVSCVLTRDGGRRCVREMVELLLEARGAWQGIVASHAPR
jgi:3-deoxy-D-manno-octulosonate 8-phosphate phosphatase (KDO 8-P phosphatase)